MQKGRKTRLKNAQRFLLSEECTGQGISDRSQTTSQEAKKDFTSSLNLPHAEVIAKLHLITKSLAIFNLRMIRRCVENMKCEAKS